MEQRIEHLEIEQRSLLKRVEDLEKAKEDSDFTLKDIKHETTIIHGLSVVKFEEIQARLERIDNRVTEAHNELGELIVKANKHDERFNQLEQKLTGIEATQQKQGKLLQQILEKLS